MLWDMTADKDVANCLLEHDILAITKCVIEESVAPRLTVNINLRASMLQVCKNLEFKIYRR